MRGSQSEHHFKFTSRQLYLSSAKNKQRSANKNQIKYGRDDQDRDDISTFKDIENRHDQVLNSLLKQKPDNLNESKHEIEDLEEIEDDFLEITSMRYQDNSDNFSKKSKSSKVDQIRPFEEELTDIRKSHRRVSSYNRELEEKKEKLIFTKKKPISKANSRLMVNSKSKSKI
jgi:hypothetical protein